MIGKIYLDNAATTFPKPEAVYAAMDNANRNLSVNAGRGSYALAQEASTLILDTKKSLRKLIHADENVPVVFSPSITIALNQIIQGYAWKKGDNVYVSPYEHNAVARTLHFVARKQGLNIHELPIDSESGEINIEKTKYVFGKEQPRAVFCTHVSNVTGYILPIEEIFAEAKKYSALTVLDTAQSLGLIELNIQTKKNIDILAFAGHKGLYGPIGIGGFVNISKVAIEEFIVGGTGSDSLNLNMPDGLESKYESASCNIVAIAGLKAALGCIDIAANYEHQKKLTDYLTGEMKKIKGVELFTPVNPAKHIGIVSFAVKGMKSDDVGMILDEDFGIAVRTGYHCAPYIHKYLGDEKYLGTVRVGIGQFTTKQDVDKLLNAIDEL